jgi:hypothetical protein
MDSIYSQLANSPRSSAICDYLRFTTPVHSREYVFSVIQPYLSQMGCIFANDYWKSPSGGTFTVKQHYQVVSYQHTGSFLRDLRDMGLYSSYIADISLLPEYRLTKAHFAVDVAFPAPYVLPWLLSQLKDGKARISQKFVLERDIKRYMGFSQAFPGMETGTLYLGSPKAEKRLKAYDKAQERYDRKCEVIKPTTRFEIELSDKTGLTVKDLADCDVIFYHHVPSDVLPTPEGIPKWQAVKAVGGYKVDRQATTTAYARAKHILQGLEPAFKSIAKLAHEDIERSEEFKSMVLSHVQRMLSAA